MKRTPHELNILGAQSTSSRHSIISSREANHRTFRLVDQPRTANISCPNLSFTSWHEHRRRMSGQRKCCASSTFAFDEFCPWKSTVEPEPRTTFKQQLLKISTTKTGLYSENCLAYHGFLLRLKTKTPVSTALRAASHTHQTTPDQETLPPRPLRIYNFCG